MKYYDQRQKKEKKNDVELILLWSKEEKRKKIKLR